jgi:hypothetical protein
LEKLVSIEQGISGDQGARWMDVQPERIAARKTTTIRFKSSRPQFSELSVFAPLREKNLFQSG